MARKIKGIRKSFKFISQIFVKEREMEIGHPTDVKHVAHIGQDSPSVTGPSWMNEFRTSPNFATPSFDNPTNLVPLTTCFNPDETDMEEPMRSKPRTVNNSSSDHHSNASKKNKNRKTKSTSSPRSSSSSSSSTRRSRAPKSKLSSFSEATPTIQV